MKHLLGIDIGTTGAKAIIIDVAGAVKATAVTEYPLSMPKPGWAEQNPDDWWNASVASIRTVAEMADVTAADILAIGLTGQMHGLVLLDQSGNALRPCILWNDQRTAVESDEIHRRVPIDRMIQITGKPALPNFTAAKILWVRRHEPDVYNRSAAVLLPKDFVRFRLTGQLCCEVSDASGTALLDVGRRCWSDEVIDQLEISRAWLPRVLESTEIAGMLSRDAASRTGLIEGTPVIAGAGDQAAEAVGVGAVNDGEVSVAIGTSGVVFVSFDEYRIDPAGRLHAYCHASPEKWHMMGVMLSAGGSFRWFRDVLGREETQAAKARGVDSYEVLTELAATAPPGCEGLLFLPYLTGERTPHADPDARGAFIGLSLRHHKAHLVRSVIEGVTFGLLDSINLVRDLGLPVKQVRVSGGGARSAFWRQVLADVFNAEVVTVNSTHGAAFGAALLAGVGAGVFAGVDEACRSTIHETRRTGPGQSVGIYPAMYERFRTLYPALRDEFRAMAKVISINPST